MKLVEQPALRLKRCGGRCGYDAEAAQAAADLRARRPKTPKLAGDPVLAAAVGGLLLSQLGWEVASAFDEVLGSAGTLGRDSQSEPVLSHRLRDALRALNPGLPECDAGGSR